MIIDTKDKISVIDKETGITKYKTDIIANKEIWFISYTDSIKHHGYAKAGQQITTTQKVYEEFYTEKDY